MFALYYLADPKLIELGLLDDPEAYKAEYDSYIRNGIFTQFTRIEPGKQNTEAHMQNRKLIADWCFEKGAAANVIEMKKRDGKTYFVINDYEALRRPEPQTLPRFREPHHRSGRERRQGCGLQS